MLLICDASVLNVCKVRNRAIASDLNIGVWNSRKTCLSSSGKKFGEKHLYLSVSRGRLSVFLELQGRVSWSHAADPHNHGARLTTSSLRLRSLVCHLSHDLSARLSLKAISTMHTNAPEIPASLLVSSLYYSRRPYEGPHR